MKWNCNAKTQRRKGARLGSETSSLINDDRLLTLTGWSRIFFASLRLCASALSSSPFVRWMQVGSCLMVIMAGAGCVSQKKQQLEARRAFVAGQEQAMEAAMRARQDQGPVVFVQGQVRNSAVTWEEGMKLSQAIVAADYTAFMNPRLVRVLRNGQIAGEFKGIDLLHHADMELENGDTVLLVP